MSRPSDDFTAAYEEWLVGAPSNQALVETIEVTHSTFGPLYFANWHSAIDKTLNDTVGTPTVTFNPVRFFLEPSGLDQSTQQAASLGVSAFDGELYDAMRAMTMQERDDPITIKIRLYLHDQPDQLINPAPIWNVHSSNVGFDAVRFDLRADPLRIRRTGRYYTATEFPLLRVIR